MSWPVTAFQNPTVPSSLPLATVLPPGLKATESTAAGRPVRMAVSGCAAEDCGTHGKNHTAGAGTGSGCLSGGRESCAFWKLGFRQYGFHQYHADLPARRS
jgi:hypothetical protein